MILPLECDPVGFEDATVDCHVCLFEMGATDGEPALVNTCVPAQVIQHTKCSLLLFFIGIDQLDSFIGLWFVSCYWKWLVLHAI